MDKRPKSVIGMRGAFSRDSGSRINPVKSNQSQNPNLKLLDKMFKSQIKIDQEKINEIKKKEQQKKKEGRDQMQKNEKQKKQEVKDQLFKKEQQKRDIKNLMHKKLNQSLERTKLSSQQSISQTEVSKVSKLKKEVNKSRQLSKTQKDISLEGSQIQQVQTEQDQEQISQNSPKTSIAIQSEDQKTIISENPNEQQNQEDVEMQEVQCVLDAEDFPIVSEIHHLTGRCYCDYCSCGKHFCPSVTVRGLYSQSTYRTQYQKHYKTLKNNYPLLKTEREKFVRVEMPSDYKTINQQDFCDTTENLKRAIESRNLMPKSPSNPDLKKLIDPKFLGTTRPQNQQYFKRPILPVRQMKNVEMKTTYRNDFHQYNTQQRLNSSHDQSRETTEERQQINTRSSNRSNMSNLPFASLGNLPFNAKTTVQADYYAKKKPEESPYIIKKQEPALYQSIAYKFK